MRDPRHNILFEPLAIGPKVARNRFYQVPHCNGMGHREPTALAGMRAMKAEGGWAVICTEEVEIHPSSEVSPAIEGRIWEDKDIFAHERVVEGIHRHGALAGIELVYNGPRTNLASRLPPMGVNSMPVNSEWLEPQQSRAMDREDFRAIRRWHRNAALRARKAGYDLIYVYAGHGLTLTQQLLSRATNDRTDEYGGSLENRVRFLRELLEDTRDAVGHDCAVPLRIAVEESQLPLGLERAEMEDIVGMLAELPDLWDFCMGSWSRDSRTARFSAEGFQEPFVRGLKKLTTKPVVGVGRFTSPDAMVEQIRSGVLDFIGAARPSIADPFLPKKIEEGRSEDLRECIGCNICVAGDMQSVPLRCTQNPTMGEEWRRGWHPEKIAPKAREARVLVIGAGPAGLEAAHQLGKRGYEVALTDARDTLGGRVVRETTLPGLRTWQRVADYRLGQIGKLANVETYPASFMTADDVLAFGATHVAVATGARFRANGRGRNHPQGIPVGEGASVFTPDDIFEGAAPSGDVVVYDDDHYAIGSALAEKLAAAGCRVTLVTPAPLVSHWTHNTLEQGFIEARLVESGVAIVTRGVAAGIRKGTFAGSDGVTGRPFEIAADHVVLVASREPQLELFRSLKAREAEWADAGLESVTTIGDAHAPGMIVHATYAGHRYARELDMPVDADAVPFLRDQPR
ncbi:oxidoreductase [Gellertiella hungarica]|uniref:Dimethylamine/trimethylamine dehydrogenase n=1 Tax=Gellertiella hungarica TaxID=1572859 RepID=A0A7W6J591_9HYPH|nr:FAD-dependent oxidoreductase [Gellertiella hungarica]MBB4065041.1 dimethylamine/trimethylamine dehydrogenase [Gellertiella hungarica]